MKAKYISLLVSAVLALSLLHVPRSAEACGLSWSPSVKDALNNARLTNRLAVVVFTGSDWSPRSIKLDEEVLMNAEFGDAFMQYFALVNADFPQRPALEPALLAEQTAVATKYDIRAWPTLLALRPDGTEFARLEYTGQPAAEMIRLIGQWQAGHDAQANPDKAPAKSAGNE